MKLLLVLLLEVGLVKLLVVVLLEEGANQVASPGVPESEQGWLQYESSGAMKV